MHDTEGTNSALPGAVEQTAGPVQEQQLLGVPGELLDSLQVCLAPELKEPWCFRTNFQGFLGFANKHGCQLTQTTQNSRCFLFKLSLMPHKLLHVLQRSLDIIISNITKPEANGMVPLLTEEWETEIAISQDGRGQVRALFSALAIRG